MATVVMRSNGVEVQLVDDINRLEIVMQRAKELYKFILNNEELGERRPKAA